MEPVYTPVITTARLVFAAQGLKFRIEGAHNVPRVGGAVMAINHTGYFDFTYAGLAALDSKRLVRFMAKTSIFSHRVAGPLMRGMKHIPVDREAGLGSFDAARDALRSGEIIGVFPEATISRSFELKAFKSGTVRLAQEAGVPILPVTIWGSQRVWTKGQPRKMGRHVIPLRITVGAPSVVGADEKPGLATVRVRVAMETQLRADQALYPAWPDAERHLLPTRLGGTAPTPEEADAMDVADRKSRRRTS